MTPPPASRLSPRAKSLTRLLVTLEISLALHLAIIFGIQVGAVERAAAPRPVLEARLMTAPAPSDSAMQVLVKAIDRPIKSHVPDYVPPTETPIKSQAAAEPEHKPGMPEAAASPTMVDAPLPPDPKYYPRSEVDEPATWLVKPVTEYPERAAKENISGEVAVLLLADEFGNVQEVSVIDVKPAGYGFEEKALASVPKRIKPAMRNGRAVKSRVLYRVSFEP